MSARRLPGARLALITLAIAALAPASALAGARDSAAAPSVLSMVVGSGGVVLSAARTLTASATTVTIAHKRCAVAAATPLAVLAALRRAGGPAYALRDYGRCGGGAVNSGQLFVYSLAGQLNRGQDGWEYKVNGVSGSTGAADSSGPQGDGRLLRSGDRVLWFWCNAFAGGCQRTLEVSATSAVSRSASLAVSVRGYDNEGRAVPVSGVIVKLGTDFASTRAGGRAVLIAPSTPGRYQLSATRAGLVPSFPETIVVR
jgi:hypothetical protein